MLTVVEFILMPKQMKLNIGETLMPLLSLREKSRRKTFKSYLLEKLNVEHYFLFKINVIILIY